MFFACGAGVPRESEGGGEVEEDASWIPGGLVT